MVNSKKKILIIEDEKPLLMAMKSKLQMVGFDVVSAEDGEEGERLIEEEKPDLVLLDILLPKKDGLEVLESLHRKKNTVPIIIISNSGQPVEIDRVLKLGVKDYLVKADFTPQDVLDKVEKIIGFSLPDKSQDEKLRRTVSVLIVEDDEFLREVISRKLSKEGFDVQAAIDAKEALEIIKKKMPQIILLDLILPGMDGYEFLAQIKKEPVIKDVPVIILSNLCEKDEVDSALAAGAADYLIKANFSPAEIVQKVKDVLGQKYL